MGSIVWNAELLQQIGVTTGAVAACVLFAATASHVREPQSLTVAIREHSILPGPVRWWLIAVTGLEGLLSVGVLASLSLALFVGRPMNDRWFIGLAFFYACLAFYAAFAARRSDGLLPCGCGLGSAPMGKQTVARALALVVMAAIPTVAPLDGSVSRSTLLGAVVAPPLALLALTVSEGRPDPLSRLGKRHA